MAAWAALQQRRREEALEEDELQSAAGSLCSDYEKRGARGGEGSLVSTASSEGAMEGGGSSSSSSVAGSTACAAGDSGAPHAWLRRPQGNADEEFREALHRVREAELRQQNALDQLLESVASLREQVPQSSVLRQGFPAPLQQPLLSTAQAQRQLSREDDASAAPPMAELTSPQRVADTLAERVAKQAATTTRLLQGFACSAAALGSDAGSFGLAGHS
eukprot:TRINITY_DN7538_c0_g2_i2.p1 TRINITY_DN7538_c0_g2~~TRINITY_DN7538_c0_g2_i2.p1  ORF type:complete len:254 (-),score=53.99 TRINITY_DN7538_c0_g2_i2:86-739(-)